MKRFEWFLITGAHSNPGDWRGVVEQSMVEQSLDGQQTLFRASDASAMSGATRGAFSAFEA